MAENKIFITYNFLYVVNKNGIRAGQAPPGCVGCGSIGDRHFGYIKNPYVLSRISEYFPKVISEETFEGLKLINVNEIHVENKGTFTSRPLNNEEIRLKALGIIEMKDWITRLKIKAEVADLEERLTLLQKRASVTENVLMLLTKNVLFKTTLEKDTLSKLKRITDVHTSVNVSLKDKKTFFDGDVDSIIESGVLQDVKIADLEKLIKTTKAEDLNDLVTS